MMITKKWVTLFCLSLLLFATACSGGATDSQLLLGKQVEVKETLQARLNCA